MNWKFSRVSGTEDKDFLAHSVTVNLCLFILPRGEVFAPSFMLLIKLQTTQLTGTPPFVSLFQQRYGLKII